MKYAHPDDLKKSDEALEKHFNGEAAYYEVEARMKHKSGKYVWVLDRGKVIKRDEDGKPLMMFGTHADITEKKCFEERLKEIAVTDSLTGIYNRRYFFTRMNEIYEYYKRVKEVFSLVIIDIDYFKKLNDHFGHLAGDFVLKKFTKILLKNIRSYDLLGRYGGEEFIIMISGMKKNKAVKRIDNILNIVRDTIFNYEDNNLSITFSGGVADVSELDCKKDLIDSLIKIADERLYAAKQYGRNMVLIDS